MQQVRWFDRSFHFNFEQNIFPSIIERLRGTPARLEEKIRSMDDELLTRSVNGAWTIKENIGHLADLEPLWQGRLDDILSGKEELRPTDLQNRKTTEAQHNSTATVRLLQSFREIRRKTIEKLEKLTEEDVYKTALHPRLKTPMRAMDLFLFVADHDDHHLARMSELARIIKAGK